MALTVVTRQAHADKRWMRRFSYAFAAQDNVAPILASEVAGVVHSLPIALIKHNGICTLVAVMGVAANQNLLVAEDGSWLDYYMPLGYRTGPFRLATDDSGDMILCVDEDTGLISDREGEPFFQEDGETTPAVNQILGLLGHIDSGRKLTDNACAVLDKHGLLEPWTVTLTGPDGELVVEGLYRINETALNALSDEAFLEIRHAHALPIAYSQLVSMQNINAIARLYAQRTTAQAKNNLNETFSFSNL
jgi:hypothetical protein